MSKIIRKVGLEGVRFVSPIGYFPEERVLKNEFLVNLSISFSVLKLDDTDNLDNTIDYSELFEICAYHFSKEAKLIETVAHEILEEIVAKFSFSEEICLRINKLNPPVKAEIKNSFVELIYQK